MIILNSKDTTDIPEDIRSILGQGESIIVLEPNQNGEYGIDPNDINYQLCVYTN